jgi:hypothetical protein
MKRTVRWAVSTFGLLLRLYPRSFQAEFGREMQGVFTDAVDETHSQGQAALARLFARELTALPGSLLREHRDEFQKRRGEMSTMAGMESGDRVVSQAEKPVRPVHWGLALLAGLPFLLFAFKWYPSAFLQPFLYRLNFWTNERQLAARTEQILWLLTIIVLLAAIWKKFPRWSPTWIGCGMVGIFDLWVNWFPDDVISLIGVIAWLMLLVGLMVWFARHEPLSGVLLALPIVPMFLWLLALDGVMGSSYESVVYNLAGWLMFLAATLAVRRGNFWLGVGLAAGVTLLVGSIVSFGTTYMSNMPVELHPPAPTPGAWLSSSVGNVIWLAVFTLPVWVLLIRRLFRASLRHS